jgi:hypothetical protein
MCLLSNCLAILVTTTAAAEAMAATTMTIFYLYDSEQQRESAMYIALKQTNIVPVFPEYVLMKFTCDLSL